MYQLKRTGFFGWSVAVCLSTALLLPASDADAAAVMTIRPDARGVLMSFSGDGLTFVGANDPAFDDVSANLDGLYGAVIGSKAGVSGIYSASVVGGPIRSDSGTIDAPGGGVSTGELLGTLADDGEIIVSATMPGYNMDVGFTISEATLASISTLWAGETLESLNLIPGSSATWTLLGGDTLTVQVVPIPAAAFLFAPAIAGLVVLGRRKAKAAV